MTIAKGLRAMALGMMWLAAGCASMPAPPPPPPATARDLILDNCCSSAESFHPDMVALVEGAAETLVPLAQNLELRPPRLDRHPKALQAALDAARPLDVVMVTAKYHLAGRMASGVTTHALVYLGSEAELRRAGLWSHPALRPWQDQIRQGARFVEAIKPAVRISTPAEALRVDSILVLRPRLGPKARSRAIGFLLGSVGTKFDMHFRLNTDGCLFCTELVALAMPELGLPQRKVYGRDTILSDDIAAMALRKGSNLTFVTYVRGRPGGWDIAGEEVLLGDLAQAWPVSDDRAASR